MEAKENGPFKILKKINDNSYVDDLSNNMGISNTFNVADLYPYHPPGAIYHDDTSRSSSSQVKENDANKLVEEIRQQSGGS